MARCWRRDYSVLALLRLSRNAGLAHDCRDLVLAALSHPGRVLRGLYLFLYVLGRWSASAASYAFVLMSVVGVLAAALLLDEQLTLSFAFGATLVLGGVYIGALTHDATPQKRPEPVVLEEIPDCRKMC